MKEIKKEKPNIHLLKTPLNHYFYDVNKDQMIKISSELYQALHQLMVHDNEDLVKNCIQEYEELISEGFLSDKRVKKIEHNTSKYLKDYQERKLSGITLQITQNCNLRCSYCIYSEMKNKKQRSHSTKKMSFEMAKKTVDFLLEHSIDNDSVSVGFYGGEPLLEFDLIKKVVRYAKKIFIGKKITFNMTTNATLLSDEIIDFIVKHNFHIVLSLDGPKEINDKSRRFATNGKGTFDIIIKNLKKILYKYPDFCHHININMVISPQRNINQLNQLFKDNECLHGIQVTTAMIDDVYAEEKNVYSEEYIQTKVYEMFLGFLYYLKNINEIDGEIVTKEFIHDIVRKKDMMGKANSLLEIMAPGGPCIPGQNRLLINADGDFFPCERVSEKSEVMKIGNMENGFDLEKSYNLLNCGKITEKQCIDCWAFRQCEICAKYADDGEQLSGEKKLGRCKIIKEEIEDKLLNILMLKELTGEISSQ